MRAPGEENRRGFQASAEMCYALTFVYPPPSVEQCVQ